MCISVNGVKISQPGDCLVYSLCLVYHLPFQEFQEDTEDPFFITEYLDKPLERLQEYHKSLQVLVS